MFAGKKVTIVLAIVIFLILVVGITIFRTTTVSPESVAEPAPNTPTTNAEQQAPKRQDLDPTIEKNRRALDAMFNTAR